MSRNPTQMIVAAQPEAAEAGARVLMAGGNAVDAAMAAALVQGVVDPQMCGIAGFGNCQILMPSRGVHTCIDFHGKTPAAARPDMWEHLLVGETRDGFGFILEGNVNDVGYQSITVPGSLKAYHEAVEEFGTWRWSDVCQPAIDQAERGVVVAPAVVSWWEYGAAHGRADVTERLGFSETGRRIYFRPDGRLKRIGDRIDNPDLASTLRLIAEKGSRAFYEGELAERIAEDMARNGGLLSYEDLRDYRTVRTDPLTGTYRDHLVATNHPPGGGIMLVEMMNMLEHFDLAGLGHNTAEYIRIVAEVMKRATVDKDAHVGDPAFVDVPVERLTSKEYAAGLADAIRRGERAHVPRVGGGETKDTTHVAVIDRDGNAVTMTHSLGMPSGVITDGLGFMYNGAMGVFDPRPGRAGSIAPGKGRFSALCPTMIFRDGRPRLVMGAPGGTQIVMGVLQVALNVIDHGMSVTEAVVARRFSATSDIIDVTNGIPGYETEMLERDGYEVVRSPMPTGIGHVHALLIEGDRLTGAADPGRDGVALGV